MTDSAIEKEIQAKGLTAPRVTPADVEAAIAQEIYFTPADALRFAYLTEDFGNPIERNQQRSIIESLGGRSHSGASMDIDLNAAIPVPAKLLTFCVLVLKNGYTVTGESACASPENFDAELGRKIARQNAVNKVWPLLGYALKERLAGGFLAITA